MVLPIEPAQREPELRTDFSQRLEVALQRADQQRRWRTLVRRAQPLLPIILLVSPIVGWRLMLTSPDGLHVTVAALAWVTSLLAVGVHVDTVVLSYLGLQALPSVVGCLLLAVITAWLLSVRTRDS